MTQQTLSVIVLAAGQGTRMKSDLPKVLHPLAGRPMLHHVLDCVRRLDPARIVVVVGPGMAGVAKVAGPNPVVIQEDRLGTGHAVRCASASLAADTSRKGTENALGDIMVVFGDSPLLRPETLGRMMERRRAPDAPALVGLAFRPNDAAQYGRMVQDRDGRVERIVEFADASAAEKEIELCNAGVLCGDGAFLLDLVAQLRNDNAKGEYYLTDVFALAYQAGKPAALIEGVADEVLGINSRQELAAAEAALQHRLRDRAMAGGATLIDPQTVWLSSDTKLGRDVTIFPNVFFGPGVEIEDGAEVRGFCVIEGARIAAGATIGPFARLRPGAQIGVDARVGNFVEIKNAVLEQGAKANHLSYVGDSRVGARSNIGAGTITCNYDGFDKHHTEIGAGVFIGSNTALVAPVSIGDGAIVGAGSTISQDVEADALAVARSAQTVKSGGAKRFRDKRKAAKPKG